MFRWVSCAISLVVLGLSPHTARGADAKVEFKPEARVCVEGSGTFVKGGACWVMDLKKGTSQYEFQFCVGLVVEGGVLVAGGQASVMVCGTLVVPVELVQTRADKVAWKKVAERQLRAYLTDPKNKDTLKKATGKVFDKVKIEEFRSADEQTKRTNQKAIKKSKAVPLSPCEGAGSGWLRWSWSRLILRMAGVFFQQQSEVGFSMAKNSFQQSSSGTHEMGVRQGQRQSQLPPATPWHRRAWIVSTAIAALAICFRWCASARGDAASEADTHLSDDLLRRRVNAIMQEGAINYIAKLLPVGIIMPYAGPAGKIPEGWLPCDGQILPEKPEYKSLAELLGRTYDPAGSKVRVPDLRGRSPIGAGAGGPSLTARKLGEQVGQETVTLTVGQMPKHAHSERMKYNTGNNDKIYGYSGFDGGTLNLVTGVRGGEQGNNEPHGNMQPSLAVNFIIRYA